MLSSVYIDTRGEIIRLFDTVLYETESGNIPLKIFLCDLAKKHKEIEIAQIRLYISRLEEHGLEVNKVYPKTIKHIKEKIYELRPGSNRVLFFYYDGDGFVLLHGFTKKTQKTPKKEIDKADSEYKDYIRRNRL